MGENSSKMEEKANVRHLAVTFYPELGSGTFGIVYKATDTSNGQTVAVKKIKCIGNSELMKYAKQELDALKVLPKHQNIVNTMSDFEHEGCIWIVMEHCEGDLQKYLDHNKSMSFKVQVYTMHQSSSGIAFLHSQRPPIYHRDIKLNNFLVKQVDGRYIVKACDFGLAKCLGPETVGQAFQHRRMFATLAGSPPYMAPEFSAELEDGLMYDSTVDVFALGLVFQQILEPNRPDYYPLSVEAKKAKHEVNIGYEMVTCYKNKRPMPNVVEILTKDDVFTKRLKRIIKNMTQFRSVDRKNIVEVEEELEEILQSLEREEKSAAAVLETKMPSLSLQSHATHMQEREIIGTKPKDPKRVTKLPKRLEDGPMTTQSETQSHMKSSGNKTFWLSNLTTRKLNYENMVALSCKPLSIRLIHSELWICHMRGISVYNLDLTHQRDIPGDQMGDICGAVEAKEGVVIGGARGLFTASTAGENIQELASGKFGDVCYHDGRIYAARYWFFIHVYDYDTRHLIQRLSLPGNLVDDSFTMRANGSCMVTGHIFPDSRVNKFEIMHNASQQIKLKGTEIGTFSSATRVCQIYDDGTVLIGGDGCLYLYTSKWCKIKVPIPDEVNGPMHEAVFTGDSLFVLLWCQNQILKFSLSDK